jgi:hypothetical protein
MKQRGNVYPLLRILTAIIKLEMNDSCWLHCCLISCLNPYQCHIGLIAFVCLGNAQLRISSGSTNILFCQHKTQIIQLARPAATNVCCRRYFQRAQCNTVSWLALSVFVVYLFKTWGKSITLTPFINIVYSHGLQYLQQRKEQLSVLIGLRPWIASSIFARCIVACPRRFVCVCVCVRACVCVLWRLTFPLSNESYLLPEHDPEGLDSSRILAARYRNESSVFLNPVDKPLSSTAGSSHSSYIDRGFYGVLRSIKIIRDVFSLARLHFLRYCGCMRKNCFLISENTFCLHQYF